MFKTHPKGATVSSCWPRIVIKLMFLTCCCLQPARGYSGGIGSLQAPYVISNAADLIELGQNPHDYDKHFMLENDIDLSAYTFNQAVIAAYDVAVMGHHEYAFSGSINGNGHVIRNLSMSGTHTLGLFGALSRFAQVYGLGVVDANIVGKGNAVGMLAGSNEGQICNSFCTGVVSGRLDVGGLAGSNNGSVLNSYSSGQVMGIDRVGGLIGQASSGSKAADCYSSCRVHSIGEEPVPAIGGLIGLGPDADDSFWNVQTSEISDDSPDSGLNTQQMQDINTYLDVGWDFLGEVANGCQDIWSMPEGGGYPVLSQFQGVERTGPAVCGDTVGRCMLSLDPDQVIWDASAIFAPSWESATLTRMTLNPNEYLDNDPDTQDIIITVSGKIDISATQDFLSLDTRSPVVCQAIDDKGMNVGLRGPTSPIEPVHCWTLFNAEPRYFELQLPLVPGEPVPTSLSQLDFFVHALYANPLLSFEIPYAVTDDWLEPIPGFRILVETADYQDGECNYIIQEQISSGKALFRADLKDSRTCYSNDVPRLSHPHSYWNYIYTIDLISAQGTPEPEWGTQRSVEDSTGPIETTKLGRWSNCTGEEVIRYTVAVQPQRLLVPVTLTDVSIGNFLMH